MTDSYGGRTSPPMFPTTIPLVDDSVAPTGANVNPGLEGLMDGLRYLKLLADAAQCQPVVTEFLADGTIEIPSDALPWAIYEGCGGGGAGGRGGYSVQATNQSAGGGGGGGAVKRSGFCPLVPGESYAVEVGSGGVGVDALFGAGLPGGDTVLTRVSTSSPIVTCRGAAGGQFGGGLSGLGTAPTNLTYGGHQVARGGKPVKCTVGAVLLDQWCEPSPFPTMHADYTPQAGGLGVCATWPKTGALLEGPNLGAAGGAQGTTGMSGNDSPEGFSGGLYGTLGTNVLSGSDWLYGGGAGGGGGAGPYGNGGGGGNGTGAVASGVSAVPTDGVSAAANTGAGGGGGGGAGGSPTAASSPGTATHGGFPGDGGSGRFRIIYFRKMQLP